MTVTAILEQPKNLFSSFEKGEWLGFVISAGVASRVPAPVGAVSLRGTRGAALHGDLGAVVDSGNSDASRGAILSAVVSPSIFPDRPARFGSSNFQAHLSNALSSI
jgi:hypothetical protein